MRSKSPFRRRMRAEILIADIRKKEEQYLNNLRGKRKDEAVSSEIEVVLKPAFGFQKSVVDGKPIKEDMRSAAKSKPLPDSVTSSSGSAEEPIRAQKAREEAATRFLGREKIAAANTKRFMEKQKEAAARNSRKSIRDHFIRPYKPAPSPNPRQMKAHGGKNTRSNGARGLNQDQTRGRPRTRGRAVPDQKDEKAEKTGCSNAKENNAKSSLSSRSRLDPLLDCTQGELLFGRTGLNANYNTKPVTIELSQQSRVSELSNPAPIERQASLGKESITDVRQALKRMEQELKKASSSKKRVSRDKIMYALNFMAKSLHHEEQKKALAKDMEEWVDESVFNPGERSYINEDDDEEQEEEGDSDDYTLDSDDCSSTFDFGGPQGTAVSMRCDQGTNASIDGLFSLLRKYIEINEEDKTAAQNALADLLASDLIACTGGGKSDLSSTLPCTATSGTSAASDAEYSQDPFMCSVPGPAMNPKAPAIKTGRFSLKHKKKTKKGSRSVEDKSTSSSPNDTSQLSKSEKSKSAKSKGSKAKSAKSRGSKAKSVKSKPAIRSSYTKEAALESKNPRFAMDETDKDSVSNSSHEGTEFWRYGDPYARNDSNESPVANKHETNYSGNYKLSYSSPPERPDFESEFLQDSVKEDDDFSTWDDSLLHSAENLRSSPRMTV